MRAPGASAEPPCERASAVPVFELISGEADHPELARWRTNVGLPVALDLAPSPPVTVDVLCWNLCIGRSPLGEMLDRLASGEFGGAGANPERPLVVLAQEAYRADESVPSGPQLPVASLNWKLETGNWLLATGAVRQGGAKERFLQRAGALKRAIMGGGDAE